jgi:ADP-ribosyl-[dinitrogen reductase] hydrolase
MTIQDRILGCLLGGALGDAWGGGWEGTPGPIRFEIPARAGLSDDTQLTLATCESILEKQGIDPEHLASLFLRWHAAGRIFGIGASTLKAVRDLAAGVHWALSGRRGEFAAGNGAAMRIAPLAFLLDPTLPGDRSVIRDVCRITHNNDEAYAGALAVVLAIRSVLIAKWSPKYSFLSAVANSLPDCAVRDRIEELLPLRISPSEAAARFGATGYVVDSVPLALYCAQWIAEEPLSTVLARAIGAGGDTDTIASIAGQVAGAVVGASGLPTECFDSIDGSDEVFQVATRFAAFAQTRET